MTIIVFGDNISSKGAGFAVVSSLPEAEAIAEAGRGAHAGNAKYMAANDEQARRFVELALNEAAGING